MIKKLRKEFITIATVAVVAVMVLLCVIVNVANFVSVNARLNATLDMIGSDQGRFFDLDFPDKLQNGEKPQRDRDDDFDFKRFDRQFNEEMPFSTRFFVLYYDESGSLLRADLTRIAAVTEDDTQQYLDVALRHGEGTGFTDGYKFKVTRQEDGSYAAIFLDDYREMSSARTILLLSVAATVVCSALIWVLIVLFSKRAVKPAIESNRRQKQFITDAGHELKTPITVISTSLGVLEMEVGKQKWIDKARAQTEKLTELVNSLVTLSKMDEESANFHLKEFDVSEAVRETAESFQDYAEQTGHALQIQVAPSVTYTGDEYAVRQLCSILIDNAVKYASENTPIRFSLQKEKKGVVITCENESDGVDVSKLDRLFDRFYRADQSRSSQTGGFGIGLSIARSVCEAHKGSIKAECDDGRTVRFIAHLK